jgi:hypothetical protein
MVMSLAADPAPSGERYKFINGLCCRRCGSTDVYWNEPGEPEVEYIHLPLVTHREWDGLSREEKIETIAAALQAFGCIQLRRPLSLSEIEEELATVRGFSTVDDIVTFAFSLMLLAAKINDGKVRLILEEALAAGDTSSPTERLGETLIGLSAALELMGDDYPSDIVAGAREALEVGWKAIRKANQGL